ncbi:unnamed protein product [Bursaphelenchus okinawaensis]|uniref:G-patch domain-containing protein n=1 Tax=Bursaphelenchus okinawaensis TaxID=465554 RepID=A0A811KXF5_9BILA|nr:unnamed protein product [Bursaphelenchus okinawaensis]CAG9112657.1 unnamed protein product [Bursaphelenchus okinawaensis]
MWESNGQGSVADMVAQAAADHLMAVNLPGFVYQPEVGMYYSYESGYYFDLKTNLYYHPSTQCYYQYDHDTGQYKVYSTRNTKWESKKYHKRAKKLLGELYTEGLEQDYITVAEVLFGLVDEVGVWDGTIRTFASKNMLRDEEDMDHEDCEGEMASSSCSSDDELERRRAEEEMYNQLSCIRLMNFRTNELSIVTIDGAVLGSSPKCEIIVKDDSPKDSVELSHKDKILINDHEFVAHIHKGLNTCPDCEPGRLIVNEKRVYTRTSKANHSKEMRKLRAQFGVNGTEFSHHEVNDRAKQRRLVEGSEPPVKARSFDMYANCKAAPVKGNVTLSQPVVSDNSKGLKLLKAMGWKEGSGLGRSNQGIVNPIQNVVKNDRAGLGSPSSSSKRAVPPRQKLKMEILEKTKQRYDQTQ